MIKKSNLENALRGLYLKNPTQQFRLEYWQAFNDYAFQNAEFSKIFNRRKPSTDHWYSLSLGSSACNINILRIQKRSELGVELYISDDKELFQFIYGHKDEIESVMGLKCDWVMDVCLKMKKAFKKYI